jgi:hypothetical protein
VLCWNYSMAPSNPYWRSIHLKSITTLNCLTIQYQYVARIRKKIAKSNTLHLLQVYTTMCYIVLAGQSNK